MTRRPVTTPQSLRARLASGLRRARAAAHLTQADAAARAGLHVRTWQRLEGAQVNAPLSTIVKVAAAVDSTPEELFARR
jgi:DNA-binding XRE family transcriptional regulator